MESSQSAMGRCEQNFVVDLGDPFVKQLVCQTIGLQSQGQHTQACERALCDGYYSCSDDFAGCNWQILVG